LALPGINLKNVGPGVQGRTVGSLNERNLNDINVRKRLDIGNIGDIGAKEKQNDGGGFDVNGLLDELRNDRSGLGKGGGGFDVDAILSKVGEGKDFGQDIGDIANQLGLGKGGEKNQFLNELLNEKDQGRDGDGKGSGIELVEFNHSVVQDNVKNATATLGRILHTVSNLSQKR
jgi:hypothetical protein